MDPALAGRVGRALIVLKLNGEVIQLPILAIADTGGSIQGRI